MKKIQMLTMTLLVVMSMFILVAPKVSSAVDAEGGHRADFKMGAQYTSGTHNASTIYASINLPNFAPPYYDFYWVLLSIWDSNASYNQVGIAALSGGWRATYSWTTGPAYHLTYYHNVTINLTSGVAYRFNITAKQGFTYFSVYEGTILRWSLTAPTGGNYLRLSGYGGHGNTTMGWWEDYEEVIGTQTPEGAPCCEWYFYDQYFVDSTTGYVYPAYSYLHYPWIPSGQGDIPNGLWRSIANGNTVRVPNFQPACAMKTRTDGYFYVPNVINTNTSFIRVEELFDNTRLTGDQSGGTCPYLSFANWPNGAINIVDSAVISSAWMSQQGSSNWNYMADIVPDGIINTKDLSALTINLGYSGGTYITNLSGVTITFDTGQQVSPDAWSFVSMPQNATNFTVKQNGNPIGAMITFWLNI